MTIPVFLRLSSSYLYKNLHGKAIHNRDRRREMGWVGDKRLSKCVVYFTTHLKLMNLFSVIQRETDSRRKQKIILFSTCHMQPTLEIPICSSFHSYKNKVMSQSTKHTNLKPDLQTWSTFRAAYLLNKDNIFYFIYY